MAKKKAAGSSILDSGDDAPELTDAFFAAATVRDGGKIVCRGRPKLAAPKQLVTIRFPAETLGRLRAMGPGWQGVVVKAVEKELDNPTVSKMRSKKGTPNARGSGVGAVRARRRDVA
jgi:uncharacterized protein (DUF4415 family)